ncbi:MAG: hypothetical protein ACSLFQ_15805 [Thermoanaerobaculia bacterium]
MTVRGDDVRWTMLAAFLFAGPVLFWWNEPPARRLHHPLSPFDLTLDAAAQHWIFLSSARELLPPGASVTVHAQNPDDEMSLYMFALGLFPENRVVPRSYWGATVAPELHADYELAFGCTDRQASQRVVAEIPLGCVGEVMR